MQQTPPPHLLAGHAELVVAGIGGHALVNEPVVLLRQLLDLQRQLVQVGGAHQRIPCHARQLAQHRPPLCECLHTSASREQRHNALQGACPWPGTCSSARGPAAVPAACRHRPPPPPAHSAARPPRETAAAPHAASGCAAQRAAVPAPTTAPPRVANCAPPPAPGGNFSASRSAAYGGGACSYRSSHLLLEPLDALGQLDLLLFHVRNVLWCCQSGRPDRAGAFLISAVLKPAVRNVSTSLCASLNSSSRSMYCAPR